MMLRWLQKTGHKPITLMGGGTTKVGDPSFRSDERPLLTPDADRRATSPPCAASSPSTSTTATPRPARSCSTTPSGSTSSTTSTFLRDIGRHFSVNRMLSFESVKSRLDRDQSLSFLEFNYMILQAYDFLELHRRDGLPAADGRLRPVGQHRQRHRPDPPRRRRRGLRPDLAAPHHLRRRQDGQDRRRRRLAQRRHAAAPTPSGSSGATPPTPTSAGSSSSTPSCRSPNATASARSAAPRSTPPRSRSPTR